MPKFGVCTSLSHAAVLKAAGWDYVEENVQSLLKGLEIDFATPQKADLPIPAANAMVPGNLRIVGPDVDAQALKGYMTRVLTRANSIGMTKIVFGSGVARQIPEGFDRQTARTQILRFLENIAPIAQQNGVTIVIEPLNQGECNVLNTVGEAMTYVHELKHPAIQCLVDSYHFWLEDEPLANVIAAGSHIRHVHLADRDGRVAPGKSGTSDYVPFFASLKSIGYDELISIECRAFDPNIDAVSILQFLKSTWDKA